MEKAEKKKYGAIVYTPFALENPVRELIQEYYQNPEIVNQVKELIQQHKSKVAA